MIKIMDEFPKAPPGRTGWPWTPEASDVSCSMVDRSPQGGHWPRISIVTPSYNQGQFIEETIRSVLLQGYPELEYIIIDGGSTDNSVEIIRKYEPWLTHWESEPDKGQADAINKGFHHATGDLFAFINSDDWYAPLTFDRIAKATLGLDDPLHALICGSVQDVVDGNGRCVSRPTRLGRVDEWFHGEISLHQPGCFWGSRLWCQWGPFPIQLQYVFDRYFFTRLCASRNVMFVCMPEVCAFFRCHGSSKTAKAYPQFAAEWHSALMDLEMGLPPETQMELNHQRRLRENWKVAAEVLSMAEKKQAFSTLLRYMGRNPRAIFHRPILGALRRVLLEWHMRWQ